MVNSMAAFRLAKWYLDVTTDAGEAWIGYAGRLRLGPLRLGHASWLCAGGPHRDEAAIWSRARLPRVEAGRIAWEEPRLALSGSWRATSPAVERELWRRGAAGLRWRCLAPAADAEVSCRGRSFAGLGYVELLELEVAPWQLPFSELRWGRFLAPRTSLVWIEWRGEHPLRLVLRDGADATLEACADHELRLGDGSRLALEPFATIRAGSLAETVLARHSLLRRLLPRALRDLHEHKLLSRGVLHDVHGREISGWAIHEVVRWP